MASIFCAHREGPRGRWIEGTEKPMVAESEAGEWHEIVQRLCDDDGVFDEDDIDDEADGWLSWFWPKDQLDVKRPWIIGAKGTPDE